MNDVEQPNPWLRDRTRARHHLVMDHSHERMVRLTQVGLPTINDGIPTSCYVSPAAIVTIGRGSVDAKRADNTILTLQCTLVVLTHGHIGYLHVMESPDYVSWLRDRALGLQVGDEPPAPPAVAGNVHSLRSVGPFQDDPQGTMQP